MRKSLIFHIIYVDKSILAFEAKFKNADFGLKWLFWNEGVFLVEIVISLNLGHFRKKMVVFIRKMSTFTRKTGHFELKSQKSWLTVFNTYFFSTNHLVWRVFLIHFPPETSFSGFLDRF